MHFWGLTIDMISFIDIVLAVGLCVDYAAHIGKSEYLNYFAHMHRGRRLIDSLRILALAFMQCTGSRGKRAEQAVRSIGPAVLNGGFSTFLAILLLANSQSHAFKSFFKVTSHCHSNSKTTSIACHD
jgi:Niemann-Pick C1 protein